MDPVGLNFTDTELIKYIFYEEVFYRFFLCLYWLD